MPHATDENGATRDALAAALNGDQSAHDEDDDFRRAMAVLSGGGTRDEDFAKMLQGGDGEGEEKADDAQDFEDISDDDLPDEEGGTDQVDAQQPATQEDEPVDDADDFEDLFGGPSENTANVVDEPSLEDGDDELDALFESGTPPPSTGPTELETSQSIQHKQANGSFGSTTVADSSFDNTLAVESRDVADAEEQSEDDDDWENNPEYQLQQRLLKGMGPTQVNDDTFAELWPQYQVDRPLRFNQMFVPKNSYYPGKVPLKPPKPLQPSKLTLDIQGDHEKKFKLTGTAHPSFDALLASAEERGFVLTIDQAPASNEKAEEETLEDLADDDDDVGPYRWNDLVAVCQDWDVVSLPNSEADVGNALDQDSEDGFRLLDEADPNEVLERKSSRKRKAETKSLPLSTPVQLLNAYIDAPEAATKHLAKRVRLDLNDPHLLVEVKDESQPVPKKRKTIGTFKRDATGGLTRDFDRRYNISNDAEYEMLKKNHHGKVRAALGGNTVEHAMPALRLQFPFYKVKLTNKEARSFHRPNLSFPYQANSFAVRKPVIKKKRDIKGKSAPEIFMTSQDLSIGDNSNLLLLEYSEEYPHILSGFGMGSKLLNYYRRPDDNDTQRPKQELGELSILMGQDRSPFTPFGEIQKGEMVPTIVNAMYKAPIFKHEANETDFVAACSKTGTHGRRWFLRKVENLHVVAQEFPSMEVPGTHSRKVTDAAKRRLRRLAWRMLKKYGKVKNEPLLKHLPNTDLAQNRSKMREIMDYDKDKGWVPKKGDAIPDDDTIRGWIAPEDICLLDSMQVGDQQLRDAGYNKGDEDGDDDITDEAAAGQSLDQQLAPWNTTKNFINASQGKAMIAVVGEGDPSGRGEAFSFIRTSMKGGFKDPEESIDKKLESKRRKEGSGHMYNVADQQKAYNEALSRVWNAQKASLSSTDIPEDDGDVDMEDAAEAARPNGAGRNASVALGGEDDGMSMFSKTSTGSQAGKVMRIVRTHTNKHTGQTVTNVEVIRDVTVWKEYQRRRIAKAVSQGVSVLQPTGNPEIDRVQQKMLMAEINRLKKNHSRTTARDRSKGIFPDTPGDDEGGADSPADPGSTGKTKRDKFAPTLRRCNNCGQVGHIRTNKKLCPMLNGSIQQAPAAGDSAFGSINPGAGGASSPPAAGDGDGDGAAGAAGAGAASAAATPAESGA